MQKRSRRFGVLGIAALALCLVMALMMAAGCSSTSSRMKEDVDLAPVEAEPEEQIVLPTEPFWVLLVGNDSRQDTAEKSVGKPYSDTIMLTRVDPVNYDVTAVSIPRDTMIWIDTQPCKMNESYNRGGIDGLIDQVYNLTGIRADYYFDMGFADFVGFIDDLGGVDVSVPVDMSLKDVISGSKIHLSAGDQHLDGAESLVLSRVRKIFVENSDACRQVSDRNVMAAALKYVASHPDVAAGAVDTLVQFAETNYDKAELQALVEDFCAHADDLTVTLGTGPYWGDIDGETGQWMVPHDEDTWTQIVDAMKSGADLGEIVAPPDPIV